MKRIVVLILLWTALGAETHIHAALVAHYSFEQGFGTQLQDLALEDGTPTPNDSGTLFGNTAYVPGIVGNYALSFDGSGDFVRLENGSSSNDMLNSASGVTFALWVNVQALPSDIASLVFASVSGFGSNSRAVIDITRQGRIEVAGRSSDSDGFQSRLTNATLSLNTWYHVAGVIDYPSDTISIYINGQLQALLPGTVSFSANSTPATNSLETTLASTGGTFEFFSGSLDDVRIYNEALNGSQIAALAVPEPSVSLMIVAALAGILPWVRRRRPSQKGACVTLQFTVL